MSRSSVTRATSVANEGETSSSTATAMRCPRPSAAAARAMNPVCSGPPKTVDVRTTIDRWLRCSTVCSNTAW